MKKAPFLKNEKKRHFLVFREILLNDAQKATDKEKIVSGNFLKKFKAALRLKKTKTHLLLYFAVLGHF